MTVLSNSITWGKIPVSRAELKIETVLRCGQTFRWKYDANTRQWSIGMSGRIIILHQDDEYLHHGTVYNDVKSDIKPCDSRSTAEVLNDYFNLNIHLSDLYKEWSTRDPHFSKISHGFGGIRILRQNPWENLISFICSTNNNIKRISQMVENLCLHFGNDLSTYNGVEYFDFPTAHQLAQDETVESQLRQLGFGYRAKYIYQTAVMVAAHPQSQNWLFDLREKSYEDTHAELIKFVGVGPKVADCVCLMSLDKNDVVPVDTHMMQIAQRDYKLGKSIKTCNRTNYVLVQNFFKHTWGEYAGWAHSVLFTADLADLNNGVGSQKVVKSEKTTPARKIKVEVKEEELEEKIMDAPLPLSARELRIQKRKESVVLESLKTKKIKLEPVKLEEIKIEC